MPEIVATGLDEKDILREVPEIVATLRAAGIVSVTVTFGFGCRRDGEAVEVLLPVLAAFIDNAVATRVFRPGHADLYVSNRGDTVKITLCHESDVHWVAESDSILHETATRWRAAGKVVFRKISEGNGWKALC
jgi:hypothetical protein